MSRLDHSSHPSLPIVPLQASSGARVQRPEQGPEARGEPIVELQPLKVIGPGRTERRYRSWIEELEQQARERTEQLARSRRELETSRLVERGTGRLVDRLEQALERERDSAGTARQAAHRLMVALGGMQRENERLSEALDEARGRLHRIEARASTRRGLWGRLTGGRTERTERSWQKSHRRA